MFDSLENLSGNLVIPVVYRAISKLMKGYEAEGVQRGHFVGDLKASADRSRKRRRRGGRSRSQEMTINSEVQKIFQEIESREGGSVGSLKSAQVASYVNTLSNIATQRAAKEYIGSGSSLGQLEAEKFLVRLRESYS